MARNFQFKEVSLILAGATLGGVGVFLLDPVRGNFRRTVLKDKFLRFKKEVSQSAHKMGRNYKNKSIGFKHRAQKLFTTEGTSQIQDEVLQARVRSKFGRIVSHPRSVYVYAHDGVVTLSGPILKKEVKELIKCVKKVPGVKKVVNDLTSYGSNKGISALQGEGPAYLQE